MVSICYLHWVVSPTYQWPFFIALYNAAAYTPGISTATFFGIDLGRSSIVITLIAGVFYFLQTWISTKSMTPEQKKTGMTMLIMSPVMIIVFSFMSPAGVALYWAVGGIVMVIQQIIITYVMKPRMRKKIDEEFKNNPPKWLIFQKMSLLNLQHNKD